MLVKSQIKEISERELEDFIRRQPELVEADLKIIDQQTTTQNLKSKGRLDVLFVDSDNTLVIAELKVKENDKMLSQAIDYFDYINDNKETIARLYSEFNINATNEPRILLIAPNFPQTLINRCKWINIDIQLKRYLYLELEDDSKKHTIYFDDVNIPYNAESIDVKTIEEHLDYIKDKQIQTIAKKILEEVKQWNKSRISLTSKKAGISMKLSGRVFGALYPKREFFYIDYIEDKTWMKYDIREEDNVAEVIEKLKQSFDFINSLV